MAQPHERLRQARMQAGFSTATQAANAMGVTVATYIGHENGARSFSAKSAERYARKFRVRAGWLLTGEMPMESGPVRPDPERIPLEQWDPAAPDHDAEVAQVHVFADGEHFQGKIEGSRPEIDVRAGAGQGTTGETAVLRLAAGETIVGHSVINEWVLPDAFYRHELQASKSGSIILAVVGDSMEPTLRSGDRVILDTRQNTFASDGVYVFHDGDGTPRVKRLAKVLFSEPPRVEIISDNPIHPPQVVDLDEVMIFGRVVGRISRM